MTNEDKQVIAEWYQGCWHKWICDKPDFSYVFTKCSKCGVPKNTFTTKQNPTFDGNFKDLCVEKLNKGEKGDSLFWEFIDYGEYKIQEQDNKLPDERAVAIFLTDNALFFSTLSNFIRKEG